MAAPWIKLRFVFDKLLDVRHLSKETLADVIHAIRHYANTGEGGDAAYRPPGVLEVDFVRAAGQDAWFQVDRSDPDAPTMFVYSIEPAPDEAPDSDD